MPEVLPCTNSIWNRERWRKERDGKDVPKGAVSKVSIGDALDKFHKANAKGIDEGRAACEALKKSLKTYKDGIKSKHKDFHDRIQKQLEYFVDEYLDQSDKIVKAVPDYAKLREAASKETLIAGSEFMHWQKNGSNGNFKPSNEKSLIDALTDFLNVCNKMIYYTDKITPQERKTFDQTVYAATAKVWNDKTIMGLVKQLKGFPNKL